MRDVPTTAVATADPTEMSPDQLHGIQGGAGAWTKLGPIVKPILYPTTRLIRATATPAPAAGGCAGGRCPVPKSGW